MAISRQMRAFYKTFSQHGGGNALVEIQPRDVVMLIHIAYKDNFDECPEWFSSEFNHLTSVNFYDITPQMIDDLPRLTEDEAIYYLQLCGATNTENVIYLYLKNLSELYRRRFKFYNILRTQPFPETEQIGLRCLLEYGNCDDTLLFSWMKWRKLIYDIDNRSAQETGYLFEPILASCLGGESVSHRYSPVKRIDDNGNPTNEGRQIDCYIAEAKEAYELKLRVTIAASGQGRFSEEMSFPYEARRAGLKPILIVFDSTPSDLLERLKKKYIDEGGSYAVGDDAWRVLTSRAGNEMGKYILKYIKPPISRMEQADNGFPSSVHLAANNEMITITDDAGKRYAIPRSVLNE